MSQTNAKAFVAPVVVVKTVATATLGNTDVWTPATGKKFRLRGYSIDVTGNAIQAIAGGTITVQLLDSAAEIAAVSLFVPLLALVASGTLFSSGFVSLGDGYLSAVANNVLKVALSVALTGGTVRVNAFGSEE